LQVAHPALFAVEKPLVYPEGRFRVENFLMTSNCQSK
jgi:hypothetical protein